MGCTSAKLQLDFSKVNMKIQPKADGKEIGENIRSVTVEIEKYLLMIRTWETKEAIVNAIEDNSIDILLKALDASKEPLLDLLSLYEYSDRLSAAMEQVLEYFVVQFPVETKIDITMLQDNISENWVLNSNLTILTIPIPYINLF